MIYFVWKILKYFLEELVVNLDFKGWVVNVLGKRYYLEFRIVGLFEGFEV